MSIHRSSTFVMPTSNTAGFIIRLKFRAALQIPPNPEVQFHVKGKPNFQPNFIDKTTSVADE